MEFNVRKTLGRVSSETASVLAQGVASVLAVGHLDELNRADLRTVCRQKMRRSLSSPPRNERTLASAALDPLSGAVGLKNGRFGIGRRFEQLTRLFVEPFLGAQ